jgi:hypothetical protein
MRQVIIVNGLAVTGMFIDEPKKGIFCVRGPVEISEIRKKIFTKNIIDNPALEKKLREEYGFGDNLPEVQSNSTDKDRYRVQIKRGDFVYSIVDQNNKKIHQGKLSGESLPDDIELRVYKFIGI